MVVTPRLSQQLDNFFNGLLERTDPRTAEALTRLHRDLGNAALLAGVCKVGDAAPDFELRDQFGSRVRLSDKRATGPVVLTFFRGGWCPFCTISLRALQRIARSVVRGGASLIAVSPQPPAALVELSRSEGLTFSLLSDHGNAVARQYGLVWQLDDASQAIYRRLGHDIPATNGTPAWELPMPAGYVIAKSGQVTHARVDPRVTHRLEPAEVLDALQTLRAPAAA